MNARLKLKFLGMISLLTLAYGCVSMSTHYVGNTVTSAPVVALHSSGPQAGSWQTADMKIDYQYKQAGEVFEITGLAALDQHYATTYSKLSDLIVYLFFLDADSRVLETSMIGRSLSGQINQTLKFNKVFKVPAETARISFGYDGRVEAEDVKSSFYLLPLNK